MDRGTANTMKLAVTVPEAAEMIGISESMTWRLLAVGEIAKVKIGRRTLIRVTELTRFLVDAESGDTAVDGSP